MKKVLGKTASMIQFFHYIHGGIFQYSAGGLTPQMIPEVYSCKAPFLYVSREGFFQKYCQYHNKLLQN